MVPATGEPPHDERSWKRKGDAYARIAEATGVRFRGDAIYGVGAGSRTAVSAADVAGLATEDRAGNRVDRRASAGVCALWASHALPRPTTGVLVGTLWEVEGASVAVSLHPMRLRVPAAVALVKKIVF